MSKSSFTIGLYPLKNSSILDSGSTLHIFNNLIRFSNYRLAEPGDFVWAGDSHVPIHGYGTVHLEVRGPEGRRVLLLRDVAHCPTMATNLVSLRQLRKMGFWWDNRNNPTLLKRRDGTTIATLANKYDQFVLEAIPVFQTDAAFSARHKQHTTWTKRPPAKAIAKTWHERMGHPGPKALEHLVICSEGARLKGITTVQCDACGVSKMKRQVRRYKREFSEKEGERLALDIHPYERGYGGYTHLLLISDRASGMAWDYYLQDRSAKSLIRALESFFGLITNRYKVKPLVVECDNEFSSVNAAVRQWLESKHLKIDGSAPYTQAQNGGAERIGATIKEKV